jgi:adenosylcobinamide-phosphate synthase
VRHASADESRAGGRSLGLPRRVGGPPAPKGLASPLLTCARTSSCSASPIRRRSSLQARARARPRVDGGSRSRGADPPRQRSRRAARARLLPRSCAKIFSDGVVAPAFWYALFGLPGLIAYKAVNTADSMIGHRSPRYEAFGWAAARFDDLINLLPARLSGALLAFGGLAVRGSAVVGLRVMRTMPAFIVRQTPGGRRQPWQER